jgi:riboflavin synthase
MFTGIVQAMGRITRWEKQGGDARMTIVSPALDFSRIARGDSIAVNGVCLTVAARGDETLTMDVSAETLACTTCGRLSQGDEANLEIALTLQSLLGGHLVTGHVDGIGEVISRETVGGSVRLTVVTPSKLAKYIVEKGSICMDGVSLTVNTVRDAAFGVNLIPHTLRATTLKRCVRGTRVNLEVDLIARYLERLTLGARAADVGAGGVTREVLASYGFMEPGS